MPYPAARVRDRQADPPDRWLYGAGIGRSDRRALGRDP